MIRRLVSLALVEMAIHEEEFSLTPDEVDQEDASPSGGVAPPEPPCPKA